MTTEANRNVDVDVDVDDDAEQTFHGPLNQLQVDATLARLRDKQASAAS